MIYSNDISLESITRGLKSGTTDGTLQEKDHVSVGTDQLIL